MRFFLSFHFDFNWKKNFDWFLAFGAIGSLDIFFSLFFHSDIFST